MTDDLNISSYDRIVFIVRQVHMYGSKPFATFLLSQGKFLSIETKKVPKNIKILTKMDCIRYCYFYLNNFVFDIDYIQYVPFSLEVVEKERSIYFLVEAKQIEEIKFHKPGFQFSLLREIEDKVVNQFQSFFFLCGVDGDLVEVPYLLSYERSADNFDLDCLPESRQHDGFFHFTRFKNNKDDLHVVFLGKYGFCNTTPNDCDSIILESKILIRNRSQFVKYRQS